MPTSISPISRPSRRRPLGRLTAAALATLFLATATVAARADTGSGSGAVAFAQKLGNTAIAKLTDRSLGDAARVKRMRQLLRDSFDVPAVSKFVLGKYRRRATPGQLKEFEKLYTTYVAYNYAGLFKKYDGQKVKMESEKAQSNGDIDVGGVIVENGGETASITLRVRKEHGGFKVIDLKVKGVSMPLTHRQQFSSIISRNDGKVSALLDALRKADDRFEGKGEAG